MKKLTNLEKSAMMAQMFTHVMEGGMLYTDKDVEEMQSRIKELEEEIALLRDERPKMPEHKNIRGKEYYK
jgi:polyhydroxyalkanoate synthesis regulator phasin